MIKLVKPYISFEEVEGDFRSIFESGWFTKGQFVEGFRQEIKKYTGAKHSFLTTSATTALSVCLRVLGIKEGHEVLVSDFSFPATANVVEDVGAKPVFVDVSLETFNMLPYELEKQITSKTKAVIFVDAFGNLSGIHEIKNICKSRNIPLIEDAACALGSSEFGMKSGNIADLTCFSFHPRKVITTGEGGAIATNSEEFSKKLEIKLNHGSVSKNVGFDFIDYGYNFRMSELQAAMGITQLKKIDDIVVERNETREDFIAFLTDFGFVPQKINPGAISNVQSLVFTMPSKINRDDFIARLKSNHLEVTLGTYSLSSSSYYREKYNNVQKNALFLQENTLTFPCYRGVDVEKVKSIVSKSL